MGSVPDEEIELLRNVLLYKLPYLGNLVEISLRTSGVDSTLPICNDEILKTIGSTCSNLTNLDVSYNHNVTDDGLWFLIPSEELKGCPKLVKVSLFECSVTHKGIVVLLEGLPKLKFLGYRETGQCLKLLHSKTLSCRPTTVQPLQLAHLNNLGRPNRTCKNIKKLECNSEFVNIISRLCPKLNGLKVRVNDAEVMCLKNVTTFTILELVYNLGRPGPSSPGINTVQYLQLCGEQFVQLSFVCETFSTQYLKVVCEQCNNLKHLNVRSQHFNCDKDITALDKKNCVLVNLEEFKFNIGYRSQDMCQIPFNIFSYALHKSRVLTEVILNMNNTLLSDFFIEELFSSIETAKIKKVVLRVPYFKQDALLLSQVDLTIVTVGNLIAVCPELEEVGQLLLWDVSLEAIEGLKRQLQLTNSALKVIA